MADSSKALQLLAARKKLKEYQKNKKSRTSENQGNIVENRTPAESLTNSTHSSLNELTLAPINNEASDVTVSPLQNYFSNNSQSTATTIQPVNFFDHFTSKSNHPQDFYSFNKVNYSNDSEYANNFDNLQEVNKCNQTVKKTNELGENINNSFKNPLNPLNDDMVAMEYPEINPNEIYDRLHKKENYLSVSQGDNFHHDIENIEAVNNDDVLISDLTSRDDNSAKENVINEEGNMESLKQLSTQIIQLIDDNSVSDTTLRKNSDLEKKNQELIATLQKERSETVQLQSQVQVLEKRILELETESHVNNEQLVNRYTHELSQLDEQLQCHQQTVNILIAQKTELANCLTQNEALAKQKTTECDELNARLKTSRSRVADLEKELNILRTEKSKYDKKGLEQNEEYTSLMNEHQKLKDQMEESLQDISELQEKLHASSTENLKLQHEIQDLTSQLSLINIKVQQLSTHENSQIDSQIECLTQHNSALEKQIVELHNTIKIVTNERDQTNLQYQQYVQQLNGQLNTLTQKLEAKTDENESLVIREQQLISQMGELEKLLQKLQNDQQAFSSNKVTVENKKELEEAFEITKVLQSEKLIVEEKYSQAIGERDELFRELASKRDDITHLEDLIEQLQNDKPDNTKLLATIESDKVAASRAVTQNTELKKQLEEMQDIFIKMSNDKLQLTEELSGEQHKSKDLLEKLSHYESQIHTLSDAIEIKDRELISMRESAAEINKYVLQQNQLEDRLRHYEAHDYSTHALQHELQESYKRIQNLKIENEKLKTSIENTKIMENKKKSAQSIENVEIADVPSTPDRQALQNKIHELERVNKQIELKLVQLQSPDADNNNIIITETNVIPEEKENISDNPVLSKEIAMRHLEGKFTKTMQDIANLEDEKQRLEHLVLQLQGETETIGEYITLYQHQRGILKQRALEREEQMQQLTVDRELMKNKLDQLNQLVKVLLVDNGVVPPELLDHRSTNATSLCTEHAKMHHEMNNLQNGEQHSLDDAHKTETAEKIIELLGEIKTSNLVQPFDTSDSFHPCPWCSGQLITV